MILSGHFHRGVSLCSAGVHPSITPSSPTIALLHHISYPLVHPKYFQTSCVCLNLHMEEANNCISYWLISFNIVISSSIYFSETGIILFLFMTDYSSIMYINTTYYCFFKNKGFRGWRNDLAVKDTCCFYKGHRFWSQHLNGNLQPSLIPVLGDSKPFPSLHGHQTNLSYTWIHWHGQNIHI